MAAIPISNRSIDLLISLWFVVFFISTSFSDLHNFIASALGVKVDALEHMNLAYPPKAITWAYFRWARSVDPLLYLNPVWWQAIEWVNMTVLTPFGVIACVAFVRGSSWVRIPAIVISSFTLYSLIVCIGATLYGDTPSAEPATFVGVYQLYFFFPAVVIARLWRDEPFSRPLGPGLAFVLFAVGSSTFAVFFSYILKWMVTYTPAALPAAALAPLQQLAASLP